MVIGETGSGKSTFINTVVNFFRRGSLEGAGRNLKVAIPTEFLLYTEPEGSLATEANVRDGTRAQTKKCTPYKFDRQGKSITVIDTPGLNDTDGPQQDD